ncbi:ribonuclease III [Spirulina sp. CCNP1310]|uniref:ribonuclease III n=1 Tax=Spirulina sp. CCNP1310 TaxID=3110249 RepID=UPI002B220C2F|nr:ribonuclease III [Spirulina sp. CCNP1310]MEA5417861.1 ribonuclease III [Spirulina sp. CCNP1310]
MNPFNLPIPIDDPWFRQAMAHKSYAYERGEESNERLEFLGDAILTFLCGEFLYHRYPEYTEGELTNLRASLVDRHQLAEFAHQLHLNQYIYLGKSVENSGGRDNPRLLSSAFEALIGAYFLAGDRDLEPVRNYINSLFTWALNQRQEAEPANAKSDLQAWALAEIGQIPTYQLVGQSGPDHEKTFVVEVRIQGKTYGRGQGRRKQDAEKAAARAALQQLGQGE